jgi:hypothetical protein
MLNRSSYIFHSVGILTSATMPPSQRTLVPIGILNREVPSHLYYIETEKHIRTLTSHGNRVLLEKLIFAQLVEKFPAFYGTQRYTAVFTTACHWSISWARWIQPTPQYPTSLGGILTASSYLRVDPQTSLFPLVFPTDTLYAFLRKHIRGYTNKA